MNGTIEIKLPYPHKVGFITMFFKRKIGFSFNQRSMFQLLENNDIDLPNHNVWLKDTPQSVVILETIYAGAQSYCIGLRKKDNFTKIGLSKALTEAGEDVIKQITDCWQQSEQLGYRKMPGKKKAVRR